MNQPSTSHYDTISRAFHWLTVIVIVIAFTLGPEHFGRTMREGIDPATISSVVWHESLGVFVFVLTLLRLLWVAVRPAAPQIPMTPPIQLMAKLMHLALWALMLALPISALLALGGEGHPLTLLGGVRFEQIPLIGDSALSKLVDWGDLHGLLGDAILWLAGLHAAAAIYHHVMLKDGVLLSMLPPRKAR